MYSLDYSSRFKKCRRRLIKRGYDMSKLENTINLLTSGKPMPPQYRDHALQGEYVGCRECHVEGLGDWLLIYKKYYDTLILLLTETGTHTDLFE